MLMNDKDKEAFYKWWTSNKYELSPFYWSNTSLIGIEIANTWQAACEYKQKEIDSIDCYIERDEKIKKLQAENAKLKAIVMLASEASCYTEYEDACSQARQVLKELNKILGNSE